MSQLSLARHAEVLGHHNEALSLYADAAHKTIHFRQTNPLDLIWVDQVRLTDDHDAVFPRMYTLLYHKFGNMVMFRSGNLYSLYSPGNQDYQKNIHYYFFAFKRSKSTMQKSYFYW